MLGWSSLLIDPIVLSAIFSAIAAAISALTLWFTRLKGPDIVLVNTLNKKIKVIEMFFKRFAESIPNWFEIKPIELVFANNGSRSGVIMAVEPVFKPSPEFEPFLVDFRHRLTWELEISPAPRYGTPVSIREGDNRVIKLGCTVTMVDWKYDWTDPEIHGLHYDADIKRFVENALEINRQKLASFLDFLHSGKPFGSLTLYLTCTGRKRSFGMALKRKELVTSPIEVVNSFEDSIKGYEDCLENWDDRRSGLEKALNEVPGIPNLFADKLKRISEALGPRIETHAYNIPSLRDSWKNFDNQKEIHKFAMLREKNLMKRLEFLADKIDEFNKKVNVARLSAETTRLVDLKTIRTNLKQLVEEALADLNKLKKKLAKEIFPSK